jgi:membrane protein YdbS with pleckstrin-like domain
MKINIKHLSAYKVCSVSITTDSTTIDLGWLDYNEAKSLAETLQNAADDLSYYIPKESDD